MSNNNLLTAAGMSYKEWLIGMALQGLLASDAEGSMSAEKCAKAAIKYADAVMEEIENDIF